MKRIIACVVRDRTDRTNVFALAGRRAAIPSLVPARRNVEKWRYRAGVIKLHLQSTPHYNTAACASRSPRVGIPVEISRERAANDWRRRRHRKKLQRRRGGPRVMPLGPGQSLMISLLFAHQFKPRRRPLRPYPASDNRPLARQERLARCCAMNTTLYDRYETGISYGEDLAVLPRRFNSFPSASRCHG